MAVWMTPQQVSENTGIAVGTLANWRSMSTPSTLVGPPSVKVGRLVRYDAEALEAWKSAQVAAGVAS